MNLKDQFNSAKKNGSKSDQEERDKEQLHKEAYERLISLGKKLQEVKSEFSEKGYQVHIYKSGYNAHSYDSAEQPTLALIPSPQELKAREEELARADSQPDGAYKLELYQSTRQFPKIWIRYDLEKSTYYNKSVIVKDNSDDTVTFSLKSEDIDAAASWIVNQTANSETLPNPYLAASDTDSTDSLGHPASPTKQRITNDPYGDKKNLVIKLIIFAAISGVIVYLIIN